jgi:hypothetical protein
VLRRRAGSLLLALAYLLAYTCADLAHRHEGGEDVAVACDSVCEQDGLHVSGHPSPDLSHAATICDACLFRGAPAAPAPSIALVASRAVPRFVRADHVERPARPLIRPSGRAPPVA